MNIDRKTKDTYCAADMPSRYDLNWQLCNEELGSINLVAGLGHKHIGYSVARFFLGVIRSWGFMFRSGFPKKTDVLFFVSSQNQYTAIEPVVHEVEGASVVEMCNPWALADAYFPLHKVYYGAIVNFKALLQDYRGNKDDYIYLAYHARGDLLAIAPDLWTVAVMYLKRTKPRVVVVSNDLVLWTRSIIAAAKHLGIKTVYMQHASVPSVIPPLEFDYAFLDGRDAARKYTARNLRGDTDIYLSGGARHDQIASNNLYAHMVSGKIKKVGLCTNMVDSLDAIHHVAKLLSTINKEEISVSIRAHPREHRITKLKYIALDTGARWSDPSKQSVLQFIREHSIIIAGDSSILLDAALCNRKAIKAGIMGTQKDYLGFISNGIVLQAKNDQVILDLLSETVESKKIELQDFYAPYGTKWEGNSGRLIAFALNQLAIKGTIQCKYFIKNSQSRVHELAG